MENNQKLQGTNKKKFKASSLDVFLLENKTTLKTLEH